MKPEKDNIPDLTSKSIPKKKESKRTTFKLSMQSLDAFEWIVDTYNVTSKEVFDIICSADNILEYAVELAKDRDDKDKKDTVRKTYVISNHSLSFLNRTSDRKKVSRDKLVESLVLFYKAMLEKHLEEERENEKKALDIISDLWTEAEKKEKQLKELLSDENPIRSRIGMISIVIENLHSAIESKLSKGTPIDPDDFSQQ